MFKGTGTSLTFKGTGTSLMFKGPGTSLMFKGTGTSLLFNGTIVLISSDSSLKEEDVLFTKIRRSFILKWFSIASGARNARLMTEKAFMCQLVQVLE